MLKHGRKYFKDLHDKGMLRVRVRMIYQIEEIHLALY